MEIDLPNLWRCFLRFRAGKARTAEMEKFRYHLEEQLCALHAELSSGTYRHGPYRHFTVSDAKRRDIAVASVKDRLAHRLLYEHLETIYDPVFLHDAWSCRKNKGLHRAVDRAQRFLRTFRDGWFWRADILKFFDHVDHAVLLNLLKRRVTDEKALSLLAEIVGSYARERERERESNGAPHRTGMPIGNVTSQIFANIYLHELDRFVKHDLSVRGYLRYGDDFVLFSCDCASLERWRNLVRDFLRERLRLSLHPRNDVLLPCRRGLKFLGYEIFPSGRKLPKRTWRKILTRLDGKNLSSYRGVVRSERNRKWLRLLDWHAMGCSQHSTGQQCIL